MTPAILAHFCGKGGMDGPWSGGETGGLSGIAMEGSLVNSAGATCFLKIQRFTYGIHEPKLRIKD